VEWLTTLPLTDFRNDMELTTLVEMVIARMDPFRNGQKAPSAGRVLRSSAVRVFTGRPTSIPALGDRRHSGTADARPAVEAKKMSQSTKLGRAMMVLAVGALASCQPGPQPAEPQAATGSVKEANVTEGNPSSAGFLEVNGIKLWHEIHGQGAPLLLLHGGLMAIPEMTTLLGPLSKQRKVVALELQGHGRSADTDRPLALATLGDDVAAVIERLA
jgi:hypothetical protein